MAADIFECKDKNWTRIAVENNHSDLAMLFVLNWHSFYNEFWYEAVELSKNTKKENDSKALWYQGETVRHRFHESKHKGFIQGVTQSPTSLPISPARSLRVANAVTKESCEWNGYHFENGMKRSFAFWHVTFPSSALKNLFARTNLMHSNKSWYQVHHHYLDFKPFLACF